jgi:arylsulfatase A-like enzyme
MKRLPLLLIVVGPIVAVTVGILIVRTRTGRDTQPIAAGAFRGANILLVTIDTLRADHVGAYGESGSLTPTIDGLAKEGVRFSRAYAHVPMTLPSHASLLTGVYPTRTGVHDNGAFRLDGRWDTIATVLKEAGYRTGAFVGAFVLDARFGLNHGFDTYDDRMLGRGVDEAAERPAEKVLAPAADWILNGREPSAISHDLDPFERAVRRRDRLRRRRARRLPRTPPLLGRAGKYARRRRLRSR